MYHRVLTANEYEKTVSNGAIIVLDNTFDEQVAFLKKRFELIDYLSFSKIKNDGFFDRKAKIFITFDDGWNDNYTNAFKILKKYNAPAHIFLTYNFIDNRLLFWQEKTTYLLRKLYLQIENKTHFAEILQTNCSDLALEANLDEITDFEEIVNNYIVAIKKLKPEMRRKILKCLESLVPHDWAEILQTDSFLTWEDVKKMQENKITFGSHGISHEYFDQMSLSQLKIELMESRKKISERIGVQVDSIAYPNGNYNSATTAAALEAGYKFGFTTEKGFVTENCNNFALKRMSIHENKCSSIPLFYCTIMGIF